MKKSHIYNINISNQKAKLDGLDKKAYTNTSNSRTKYI